VNEPLLRTPLYEQHKALAGRIVAFAGYELPVQYSGVTEEHHAVRHAVGLFDVSHMGELTLDGPAAAATLDRIVAGSASKLAVGTAFYTVACNERGTILDDLIIYRLAPESFLVVCNAGNRAKIAAHFAACVGSSCAFVDRSDQYALLALQGPNAVAVLQALGGDAITQLRRFGVGRGKVAGIELLAARTGYTGEDGFELFVAPDRAAALFGALIDAGKPHGLLPIGLGARDTLRLEARMMLYGNDIDETTTPFEAGISYTVDLSIESFIGKAALVAAKERGPARKLVGLVMTGRGIARHGYPVLGATDGNFLAPIGVVTSGAPGLTVGKNIALAYVPGAFARIGTALAVEIRGKSIDAVVVKTPFYKRKA
jgi:aminomethyltransferase